MKTLSAPEQKKATPPHKNGSSLTDYYVFLLHMSVGLMSAGNGVLMNKAKYPDIIAIRLTSQSM